MEEQAILRYRVQNGGTFGQALAAVIVEVAKEVRPKLYAQAVRGGPIQKVTAPVPTPKKNENLPVARNPATKGGDFNAHSPLWGDERLDQRGKMIEDFLISNDDILLNDKVPTFIHSASGSTSAIDLTIASPTVALDYSWSVHDDLCGSDHFPIILTSNTNVGQDDATFNFKKAIWQLFGELCLKSIDEAVTKSKNPTETFSRKLIEAAKTSIPIYKTGRNLTRVPWFNKDCKTAIKERKKAQRKFFKSPTLQTLINFKKAKAGARYVIKQAKKISWQRYVSGLNSYTSVKSVWRKIRKIKGKT
ncbi:ribonuclease HI [Elysia marginata]|uniref:Ribonuclease HI n=1 Tax=Elysia marginata TaxID=1093978 RepID=A0AAV4HYV6_9GAST|nr:ribonuclease HI [Elysia marginata]